MSGGSYNAGSGYNAGGGYPTGAGYPLGAGNNMWQQGVGMGDNVYAGQSAFGGHRVGVQGQYLQIGGRLDMGDAAQAGGGGGLDYGQFPQQEFGAHQNVGAYSMSHQHGAVHTHQRYGPAHQGAGAGGYVSAVGLSDTMGAHSGLLQQQLLLQEQLQEQARQQQQQLAQQQQARQQEQARQEYQQQYQQQQQLAQQLAHHHHHQQQQMRDLALKHEMRVLQEEEARKQHEEALRLQRQHQERIEFKQSQARHEEQVKELKERVWYVKTLKAALCMLVRCISDA
jgi:hypothetical protein